MLNKTNKTNFISQPSLQQRVGCHLIGFWLEKQKQQILGGASRKALNKKTLRGGSKPLSQRSTLACPVTHFGVMKAALLANTSERDLGGKVHFLLNSWVRNLINGVTKHRQNPKL